MKILKYLTFGFVLLSLHNMAFAQKDSTYFHPFSKSLRLGIFGAGNYSFTDYENSDFGISFGGNLDYIFPSQSKMGIGLSFSLSKQNISGSKNNLGLPEKFDTEVRTAGLDLILAYAASENIIPTLKVGGAYTWLGFESQNIKSRFYDISNGGEKKSISLELLGLLNIILNDNIDLNIGGGYSYFLEDNLDAIKYGDYEDFFIKGQIGLSYKLWSKRDSDGDNIEDKLDKCPFEPEDFDGYQDDDGCPDPDNDGDGIIDVKDLCQNIAEDLDGFQDDDGCPDLDNDKDGIEDAIDGCPDLAEDFDGFEDADGCPDLDNDKDGILDEKDLCDNEAEVFNGYLDDDGCPDSLPKPKYVQPEPVKVKPKDKKVKPKQRSRADKNAPNSFLIRSENTFVSGTAQIRSSAYAEMDNIINELKKYPNTRWRIEGHTDNSIPRLEANRLTKSQADAILSYFVSKGLNPNNFQTVGFGSASPISSNSSVYGRMKNRRIVIKKLK